MNDELEAELHNDLMHTLKLVPQSQRDLFVSELAKYISSRDQQIALAARKDEHMLLAKAISNDMKRPGMSHSGPLADLLVKHQKERLDAIKSKQEKEL